MFRSVFILLMMFVAEGAFGQPQRFIQQQQADQLLQRIVQRDNLPLNLWGLSTLTSTDAELLTYVRSRSRSFQPRNASVDCYLNAFAEPSHSLVMRAAWRCERQPDLGVLYLHSLDVPERRAALRAERSEFTKIQADPVIAAYLRRSVDPQADVSALAAKRPFRAADAVLIPQGYAYSDESAPVYLSLLSHWAADLKPTRRNLDFAGTFQVFLLIDSYHMRDQYENVHAYLGMLSGSQVFPDIDIKLRTYRRLAFATYYLAYYQQALDFYRRDLLPTVRRMAASSPAYVDAKLRVETDYGSILFRLGDIRAARDIYAMVFPNRGELKDPRARSTLLNNLAVAYLNTGMVSDYLSLQFQALEDARLASDAQNQLQILNNLYVFHWRRGDWENGILYLNEAYEVALDAGSADDIGNILSLYGTYHREYLGDVRKALEFNERAVRILRSKGSPTALLLVQFEKGLTLERLGRSADAIALYQGIETEAMQRNDQVSAMVIRIQRIHLLQRIGRHAEAAPLVESLREADLRNKLDFEKFVEAVNVIATDERRRGNHRKALAWLEPVVADLFTRIETSADAQTGFIRFKPEYTAAIRLLTDTHLSLGQTEAAAEVLDAVKTVNQASLRNSNLVRSSLFTEAERLADFKLNQDIEAIRSQLLEAKEEEKLELNNRLLQLQQQRITGIKPLERTLQDAQAQLGRGEVIVSVTMLDSLVYRTVVTRNRIQVDEIDGRQAMIDDWTDLGTRLRNGQTPLSRLHALYTGMLQDVMTSDIRKLVFVPDGPLHRIPIDILPTTMPAGDSAYGSVRYLVEQVPVSYATSIREHGLPSSGRRRYPSDFLGVGISRLNAFPKLNPLPYAEDEVGRISASLGSLPKRSILTGAQASERAIREQASDNRILHIASHSEVNLTDPLFSVIYLESDESEDGALYAYELFGLDLDMELIMLSSCESGSGAFIQGSGMVGLGRAFRSAGARSLIMNVWSIEDRTASDISTWFYENLNAGLSKDEALRQAKIRYITTRNSNPYVWGSFILIGENDALIKKISTREWLIGGFLVLISGGALMLFYRRRR